MAFALAVDEFAERLPPWRHYLRDQLRRASLSVLLNLRQGGSDILPREKARFYRIAKRSAAECETALEFTAHVAPEIAEPARDLARRASPLIVQLYRLSRHQMTRMRPLPT